MKKIRAITKYRALAIVEDTQKIGMFSVGAFLIYQSQETKEIKKVIVTNRFLERQSRSKAMDEFRILSAKDKFDIVVSTIKNHREDFLYYSILNNRDEHTLCEQLRGAFNSIEYRFGVTPNFKDNVILDDTKDTVKYIFTLKTSSMIHALAFVIDAVSKDKFQELKRFMSLLS